MRGKSLAGMMLSLGVCTPRGAWLHNKACIRMSRCVLCAECSADHATNDLTHALVEGLATPCNVPLLLKVILRGLPGHEWG